MISTVQDEPLFKNKIFLQQKYLSEGLSASQIAREISSARSTVSAHLTEFEIKVDEKMERSNKGQLGYGERLVKGRLVLHKGERAIISEMAELRRTGSSYGEIVNWLNSRGIKTKNKKNKWSRPTVYKILSKESSLNHQPKTLS